MSVDKGSALFLDGTVVLPFGLGTSVECALLRGMCFPLGAYLALAGHSQIDNFRHGQPLLFPERVQRDDVRTLAALGGGLFFLPGLGPFLFLGRLAGLGILLLLCARAL